MEGSFPFDIARMALRSAETYKDLAVRNLDAAHQSDGCCFASARMAS
jgi:hypothetical protein